MLGHRWPWPGIDKSIGSRDKAHCHYNSGDVAWASGLGAYAYPAANALFPHAVASAGGQALSYDADGVTATARFIVRRIGFARAFATRDN